MTSRNLFEYSWGVLSLCIAFSVWLKVVRFTILEDAEARGSCKKALAFIFRKSRWDEVSFADIIHLLAVSIVLVMALGMAFDGRYHNFQIGTLGIIAVGYFALFISGTAENENTVLEKLSGLTCLSRHFCFIA